MDWLKQHFDRVLLAVLGLLVVIFAALIISQASSFEENFSTRNTAKRPDNRLPSPEIEVVRERIQLVQKPEEWGSHQGSLFVSEPYLIRGNDPNARPVNPLESPEPLHPPIPNQWLKDHQLNYASANLLQEDPDADKFSNLEEFIGKTDPNNEASRPAYVTKLRLAEFIQKPFRLKFSGSPDDGQTFSINTLDLRQPTQFLKVGDMIPRTPYKIVSYEAKTEDRDGFKADASELTVENQDTAQKIILVYDKPVNDPTVFAKFKYLWDGSEFTVKKNDRFSIKPQGDVQYKLIDISEAEAVIESPQGDKITVPKGDT